MLKEQIRLKKAADDDAKRNQAAATAMQQSLKNLADTLTVSAADGLDFESSTNLIKPPLDFAKNSPSPCGSGAPSLTFGDSQTVDARCLPSGLSKFIDDSIEKEFAKSPPGVGERVQKGFQALMTQDRQAAKLWFEDALTRDPKNEGLRRLIELVDYTSKYQSRPKVIKLAPKQSNHIGLTEKEFLAIMFEPEQPKNLQVPQKGDEELLITPPKRLKNLKLPGSDDIAFLFMGENDLPPQIIDFPDGRFEVYQPAVGITVFYSEGPYVVQANGGVKRSTNKEDISLWESWFKTSGTGLEPLPKTVKKP